MTPLVSASFNDVGRGPGESMIAVLPRGPRVSPSFLLPRGVPANGFQKRSGLAAGDFC